MIIESTDSKERVECPNEKDGDIAARGIIDKIRTRLIGLGWSLKNIEQLHNGTVDVALFGTASNDLVKTSVLTRLLLGVYTKFLS